MFLLVDFLLLNVVWFFKKLKTSEMIQSFSFIIPTSNTQILTEETINARL